MILVALALAAAPMVQQYLNGWWIISADAKYVTFALKSSLAGPRSARQVTLHTIAKNTEGGVKENRYSLSVDCDKRTSRYLRMEAFGLGGRSLGKTPAPTAAVRNIVPGSTGAFALSFACETEGNGLPGIGYPTMLPIRTVADQNFRFIGLGLSADAAAALAAADARKAPKAFNDLLNVFVPAERQLLVRAIKTPEAAE